MKQFFVLLIIIGVVTGAKDPCGADGHLDIPNIGFRFINFRLDKTDAPFHDYHLTEGWYYVGNVTMPEHPPDDIFTCGTKFPVWLNGTHPTGNNQKTVTACQLDIIEDCSVKYDVKIKRCTGFYVYYLQKTKSSNVGYCFGIGKKVIDSARIQIRESSTCDQNTPTFCNEKSLDRELFTPNNRSAPKYIPPKPSVSTDMDVKTGRGNRNVTSALFLCNFIESKTDSLFYVVSWYMNDFILYMTEFKRSPTDPSLRLTEHIFKQRGFKMGSNVSCSVRSFFETYGVPGKSSESAAGFFAGIKILTSSLTFLDNETDASKRSILLEPTVPIGCKGSKCDIRLVSYVPDNSVHGMCTGLAFDQSSCGVKLNNEKYSEVKHIPVTAIDSGQYGGRSYEVFLQTENTNENEIWGDYSLPPIKVNIQDHSVTKEHEGKRCSSHNDPHFTTFDGSRYDNHQEGEYILYRNTKYKTEVQLKYHNCGWRGSEPIKCNCGVAVKAGQDLFEFNVCYGKYFIGYRFCDDKTLEIKSDGTWKYKSLRFFGKHPPGSPIILLQQQQTLIYNGQIFFAYGTYVEATLDSYMKDSINVDVVPSSHDVKSTVGLCGNLDGDIHNDFHYRPGEGKGKPNLNKGTAHTYVTDYTREFYHQPKQFIRVWKVLSETENLFSSNVDRNSFTPWTYKVCVCTNKTMTNLGGSSKVENSIPCFSNGVASCTKGKLLGTHQCAVYKQNRKRRSVDRIPIIPTVYIDGRRIQKRAVADSNMTVDEAKQYCLDQIGSSTVFSLCSKVPSVNPNSSIDTCTADIMLTGGTEWTHGTKESMQDACLSELRRNTTLRETTGNKTSIAAQIEELACPNNCSKVGSCDKGKCNCDEGQGGSDCSVDITKGPTLSGLLDLGMCDEKDLPCDHAYVFGSIFTDSDNLTCRLEEFVISSDGQRQSLQTHYVNGEFETLVETICPLRTTRRKRSVSAIGSDAFVTGYRTSVSNDGNKFEDGKDLFIYDSTCQFVKNTSNTIRFELKSGFCFIANKCISSGNMNPKDNCLKCKTSSSTKLWSTVETTDCQTLHPGNSESFSKQINGGSPNYLWIIGVVGVVLIGSGVGAVIVVKLTKKRGKRVSDSSVSVRQPHNQGSTTSKMYE